MTTITIGKRLIPIEQIAVVSPFDPAQSPRIQTERPFRSRVILLDRESVLAEFEPAAFAAERGFRWIMEDQTATNPNLAFGVESFAPADGFKPAKPYRSRLLWRDANGDRQSMLLLAVPEAVLAVAVRGDVAPEQPDQHSLPPPAKGGRRMKRQGPTTPQPA